MKRLLYTTLFAGLILVLAVAAVFALRGPLATQTASASAPITETDFTSVLSPAGTEKVNVIAMPLDATQQFSDAGVNFDADGLASIIGSGVLQVLEWDASSRSYRTWLVDLQDGDNFPLRVGGVYRLLLGASADIVSFVQT